MEKPDGTAKEKRMQKKTNKPDKNKKEMVPFSRFLQALL